jgi:hypothetical protein
VTQPAAGHKSCAEMAWADFQWIRTEQPRDENSRILTAQRLADSAFEHAELMVNQWGRSMR